MLPYWHRHNFCKDPDKNLYVREFTFEGDVERVRPHQLRVEGHDNNILNFKFLMSFPKSQEEFYKQRVAYLRKIGTSEIALANHNSLHSSYLLAQLTAFTDNCGIKAFQHLYSNFYSEATGNLNKEDIVWGSKILSIIESCIRWCCGTGIIVGSDRRDDTAQKIRGSTCQAIEQYGKNYVWTPSMHNANYPSSPDHKVAIFWKDLESENYVDDWR